MAKKRSLETLARTHYQRLFGAALFMCGRSDSAEDLVQETFLAAAQSLDSFEGRSAEYTWLYGSLLNKFRGWLRRRGNNAPLSLQRIAERMNMSSSAEFLVSGAPGAPEQMEREEAAALVRESLDELPEHHRSVLVLRFLDGMSYQEIAEALDCSLGTVKSRIHYALQTIAERMEKHRDSVT